MGLYSETFVEATGGKLSFSCVVVRSLGGNPGDVDILPPQREKLSYSSAILDGRRKIGAGVLMMLFEHLNAVMFEASYMHELFHWMNQSLSFWLLFKSVVLRFWCASNHMRSLSKYRLMCFSLKEVCSRNLPGTRNLHFE